MNQETTIEPIEKPNTMAQPLYKKIAETLRYEIKTKYTSDQSLPPQRKLAKKFNTSYFTIGNAVQELVAEGLVKRTVGSGTRVCNPQTSRRGLIGILTTTNDPLYLSEMFSISEAELRKARFRPVLYGSNHSFEEEKQAFHEIGSLNETGLIIYSYFHDRLSQEIKDLQRRGIHCVAVLRPIEGLDFVRLDHRMVGMLQAQHIAQSGWQKIVYIGINDTGYARHQHEGFLTGLSDSEIATDSLRDYNVPQDKDIIGEVAEKNLIENIYDYTVSVIKKEIPEVIVTFGDRYLSPVCDALRKHRLEPGEDVHLIGADNCNLPRLSYTTTDHRHGQVGKQAAKMLLERIDGTHNGPPRTNTILPKLVKHI
jgi:DNA-binding LacI/PurR family transcriptional regulator